MAFFDFLKDKTTVVGLPGLPAVHKVKAELVEDPYKNFDVEYFPFSGKYYPRHRKKYLHRWYSTGLLKESDISFAEYGRTEKEAWRIIDEMIVQMRSTTSVVYKTHPLKR